MDVFRKTDLTLAWQLNSQNRWVVLEPVGYSNCKTLQTFKICMCRTFFMIDFLYYFQLLLASALLQCANFLHRLPHLLGTREYTDQTEEIVHLQQNPLLPFANIISHCCWPLPSFNVGTSFIDSPIYLALESTQTKLKRLSTYSKTLSFPLPILFPIVAGLCPPSMCEPHSYTPSFTWHLRVQRTH